MNLETGSNNEGLWLESRSGDNLVEEMFRKIERLQSQVRNLKSRINKVKSENPEKLSSADDLDLPSGLTSSARSLNSPPNDGDRMPVGSSNIASQLLLEYNKGNMVMTGSAVSSHVEASRRPDAVESTNQSLLGATCANVSLLSTLSSFKPSKVRFLCFLRSCYIAFILKRVKRVQRARFYFGLLCFVLTNEVNVWNLISRVSS